MSEVFESIKQGLKEAIEFGEGKDIGAKLFKPSEIDIKELQRLYGEWIKTLTISGHSRGLRCIVLLRCESW